eukprot:scaffold576_cov336-Pavlova_lutheri.AAC.14
MDERADFDSRMWTAVDEEASCRRRLQSKRLRSKPWKLDEEGCVGGAGDGRTNSSHVRAAFTGPTGPRPAPRRAPSSCARGTRPPALLWRTESARVRPARLPAD